MTNRELLVELARDRVIFQMRALAAVMGLPEMTDDRDEYDPYWDYDENECWNCSGEGYVYGCSWDWQCDTYDEGEGTCLCTRRCDVCRPRPRDPELDAVLSEALDAIGIEARQGGNGEAGAVEDESPARRDRPNTSGKLV